MSSMLDYHSPHLSLPARGHGEGGKQFRSRSHGCGPVQIAQGDALCLELRLRCVESVRDWLCCGALTCHLVLRVVLESIFSMLCYTDQQ
jgi:hypothetical protein